MDIGVHLYQRACHIGHFISRYASCNSDNYGSAFKHFIISS